MLIMLIERFITLGYFYRNGVPRGGSGRLGRSSLASSISLD